MTLEKRKALARVRARQRMQPEASPNERVGQAFKALPEGVDQDVYEQGDVLPVRFNKRTGEAEFDIDAGIPGVIKGAAEVVPDVLSGRANDPTTGRMREDVITRGFDLAGAVSPVAPAARAVRAAAAARAPAAASPRQELLGAADRLGVELPRAVASDSPSVNFMGKKAADVPWAGEPLSEGSKRAIAQIDEAAKTATEQLGSGKIPLAGARATEGVESYITGTLKDRIGAKYDAVDELVNPAIARPLTATARKAKEIQSRRTTGAIRGQSRAVQEVSDALERPEGLTYEGLKNLRTRVGEMLDNPSALPADMSQAELKQIYGALTDDLRATVTKAGGTKAARVFDEANAFNARASAERKALNKILQTNSDEAAFDRIVAAAGSTARADVKQLARVRRAVSKDTWDEIGSAVISKLGRDADGNFTPDRFVTAWGKLTPAGKSILFGKAGGPGVRRALDDIATVSRKFKQLNEYANPSGTGGNVAALLVGGGLVIDPMTAITGIVGANVLSRILARPVTVRGAAAWAKAYERAITNPSRATAAALNQRAKALSVSLAKELGVPQAASRIAAELDTVIRAPAGDQQGNAPNVEQVEPQSNYQYDPRIDA